MRPVRSVTVLLALAVASHAARQNGPSRGLPRDAIPVILDAFRSHALVALGTTVSGNGNPLGDLKEVYRLADRNLVIEETRNTNAGTASGVLVFAKSD